MMRDIGPFVRCMGWGIAAGLVSIALVATLVEVIGPPDRIAGIAGGMTGITGYVLGFCWGFRLELRREGLL